MNYSGKEGLTDFALGSGGKIIINGIDPHEQEFTISRILHENPEVSYNGEFRPGINIKETALYHPLYFGQKDLASTGEGFERDLVEKLVGSKLNEIRRTIESRKESVKDILNNLQKYQNLVQLEVEFQAKMTDAEFKLEVFKKHGVEESLSRQLNFDKDVTHVQLVVDEVKSYLKELEEFIETNKDRFSVIHNHTSSENENFFQEFYEFLRKVADAMSGVATAHKKGQSEFKALQQKKDELIKLRDGLKEQFAESQRELETQLRENDVPQNIRSDTFTTLRKTVEDAKKELEKIQKNRAQKGKLDTQLATVLKQLNDSWHEEFLAIQKEVARINGNQKALELRVEYKGDKSAMVETLKGCLKGSRVREAAMAKVVDDHADFTAIYQNLDAICSGMGDSGVKFREFFQSSVTELLTWQPPNKYMILYRNRELRQHSLGQRASALILFILSQRENHVILIDQPEDDLDNQTVYEDVVKAIKILKQDTQFIFATHNANFPVLGDADQIIACSFNENKVEVKAGGVDDPEMQKAVVDIMEGGPEAFKRRKEIYQIWKQ